MNFEIVSGVGWLGALAIVVAISVGVIVVIVFFAAAKQARDEVVEDSDKDIVA